MGSIQLLFSAPVTILPPPKFFYGHENYNSADGSLWSVVAASQTAGNKLSAVGMVYSGAYYLHAYQLDPYNGSTLSNRRLSTSTLSSTGYRQLNVATDGSDNNYVVVTPAAGPLLSLAKYTSDFVSVTWQVQLAATGYLGQYPFVTTDAAGNVYTACYAYKSTNAFILVAKWNSSGGLQWTQKVSTAYGWAYGDPGRITGLVVDISGNIYVSVSLSYDSGGTYRYASLFKLSSSGALTAQRSWRDSAVNYSSVSNGLTLHSDGYLYHIGAAPAIAKFDSSLNLVTGAYLHPGLNQNFETRLFVTASGQIIWTADSSYTSIGVYSAPTSLASHSAYNLSVASASTHPGGFLGSIDIAAGHLFLPVYWNRGSSAPMGVFGLKTALADNLGTHGVYTFGTGTQLSTDPLTLTYLTNLFSTYAATVSGSSSSLFSSSAQTTCSFDLTVT